MGGSDSLHVGYYDESFKQPNEFSRRIARTIQLILQMESHLDKVIDPAGGSWYIEKLTDEVASKAWKLFQDIEAKGGMFESLKQGYPQQLIAKTAAAREKNLAKRRDVLIGTNLYPNQNEQSPDIKIPDYEHIFNERVQNVKDFQTSINHDAKGEALEKLYNTAKQSPDEIMNAAVLAATKGATIGEIAKAIRPDDFDRIDIYPVNIQRISEMFEIIRKNAEEHKSKTGASPQVYLVKVGKLSQYKPRADFAAGFFEIGGFEVTGGTASEDIADAAEEAIQSDSKVIVICSSDDNYPDIVPPLIKAIRKSKPDSIIVLAGYPKDKLEFFRQAGIDEFISSTANAFELLERISQKIGVMS
jgi:methylmalonyl-CoA mutase